MSAELTQQKPDSYRISGAIDFLTVPDLQSQAAAYLKATNMKMTGTAQDVESISVDMSAVTTSNSAALALMLEMARDASNHNLKIYFNHLPETLLTIAKAYGIESEIRDITQ